MSMVREQLATGTRRSFPVVLPLAVVAALAIVMASGLTRDPSDLPSMLTGNTVPHFDLPPVRGRLIGQSSGDLKGEVSRVNVFAS